MTLTTLMPMTQTTTPHDGQSMIAQAHYQMSQQKRHIETVFADTIIL